MSAQKQRQERALSPEIDYSNLTALGGLLGVDGALLTHGSENDNV